MMTGNFFARLLLCISVAAGTALSALAQYNQITLSISPNSASTSYHLGDALPDVLQFGVTANLTSEQSLPFQAHISTSPPGVKWLSFQGASSGTIVGDSAVGITLSVNPAGLAPNTTYQGTVTITASGATSVSAPIALSVTGTASLVVTVPGQQLVFNYRTGDPQPETQGVQIATVSNSNTQLIYTATPSTQVGGPWLLASPSMSTTPATLSVGVNAGNLSPGSYLGLISIADTNPSGLPANVPVQLNVAASPRLISQVADGTGWKTTIILVNLSSTATSFTLNFWADNGVPLALPLAGIGTVATFPGMIPGGGSVTIQTMGTGGALMQGWCELIAGASVNGLAVFRQSVEGRPDQEATVPILSSTPNFRLPFDNLQSFVTSMAVLNANASLGSNISATLHNENGIDLGAVSPVSLSPRGHTAFALPSQFSASANVRGVALFSTTTAGLAGLGLRFNPGGAFTSLPTVLTPETFLSSTTQLLSQIVDGTEWKTTITLVNLDVLPAPITLRFWRDNGTAMPLPFGSRGTVSQFQDTIPVGGSRTYETDGTSDPLQQGWAELIASSNVSGLGIFRQHLSTRAVDQEAAVPLISRTAKFVLPFDNTNGFVTSMALMNTNDQQTSTASVMLRDENGTQIGTGMITLGARGHDAFTLPGKFPNTAGKRGVAEFSSTNSDFAALGLRFNPTGSFTSFSTLKK